MTGVIEKELERQQGWEALGLSDPVAVVASEQLTRNLYGAAMTHPGRAALQTYFDEHPEVTPPQGW